MRKVAHACTLVLALAIPHSAMGEVPLPDDVNIVVPDAKVRKDVAAFSGKWAGRWSGKMPTLLIVERINDDTANVIYAYDDAPYWKISKAYNRYSAKVIQADRPRIEFSTAATAIRVEMDSDQSKVTVTGLPIGAPNRNPNVEVFTRVDQ